MRLAQAFGAVYERVKVQQSGHWTAKHIVEAAKPARSPIHSMFEWNDKIAAERHREEQARQYVRSLVVIEVVNGKDMKVPVAFSFRGEDGYRSIESILQREDWRARMLHQALADAESWAMRYSFLKELAGLRRAILLTKKKFDK